MCGIAGFAGTFDPHLLREMTNALAHRGPDAEGFFTPPDGFVGLGHRRLSIVDTEGGAQPMFNEDDSVVIVFNGEIYNHLDLRAELVSHGHVFKTDHSDTEVLIHGWEQWGSALFARLNGMFALAIWDGRKQRLVLARDRFGEKPLYYAQTPSGLAFASELGALTNALKQPEVNRLALKKYFAYGYFPGDSALYQGVLKLRPGHFIIYERGQQEAPRPQAYYTFSLQPDPALLEQNEDILAEELAHLFSQAVRRRLMSDVPLGILLSGGIDSSAILAVTSQNVDSQNLQTFTIGFEERSFDESEVAARVARHFGSRHNQLMLDMAKAQGLTPSVLSRISEPLADPSLIPTFLLSEFSRKSVTVALSGDGGDELFAGYDPMAALAPARIYNQIVPSPLHHIMQRLVGALPVSHQNFSLDFKLKRVMKGLKQHPALQIPTWMGPLQRDEIVEMFQEKTSEEELYGDAISLWNESPHLCDEDRVLEFFMRLYLPDNILVKTDRASMMVSLETRAVFLDNDLVDFCARLPYQLKYKNGVRKYLLKKALARLVPADILARKKKGFGIPAAKWLKEWSGYPLNVPIAGIDQTQIESFWREHRAMQNDHRLFLWSWIAAQETLKPQLRG